MTLLTGEAMNRTRTVLRTMLLWAMLPLTVLAGSPRPVCLCSNGDVKVLCQGAAAAHSCCPTPNPCSAKSCCPAVKKARAAETACVAATCHCTRLVVMPDSAPKVVEVLPPGLDVAWSGSVEVTLPDADVTPTVLAPSQALPPPLAGRDVLVTLVRWLV